MYRDNEIDDSEKEGRRQAVIFARGSVRLEGFNPTLEEIAEDTRYINGDITIKQMLDNALKRHKKP